MASIKLISEEEASGKVKEIFDEIKTQLEMFKEHDTDTFLSARENLLKDAVIILYSFGQYSKAKKMYKELKKSYPQNRSYRLPIDNFINIEWMDDMKSATPEQAQVCANLVDHRLCE